jgi:hypothetical protein
MEKIQKVIMPPTRKKKLALEICIRLERAHKQTFILQYGSIGHSDFTLYCDSTQENMYTWCQTLKLQNSSSQIFHDLYFNNN